MALRSFLQYAPRLHQILSGQAPPLRRGPPFTDTDCVKLIQGGLRHLKIPVSMERTFNTGLPDGRYGLETEAAVKAFQRTVAFPGKPGEWDGVLGKNTLGALDGLLPVSSDGPPSNVITGPKDVLIYISGKADDVGFGGKELTGKDSAEFADLMTIPPRPGFALIRRGFGGSLVNNDGIAETITTIITSHLPGNGGRIILYGYSAGAKQLMEACFLLDARNTFPNFAFLTKLFFFVDLLVTIDAAGGAGTFMMPRIVAGCVRKNVNFFQTSASKGGSFGGPNAGTLGPAGFIAGVDNRPMDAEVAATSHFERHNKINELAHPRAVALVRAALT